MIFKKYLLFF